MKKQVTRQTQSSDPARRAAPIVAGIIGSALYCLLFVVRPMAWWPDWLRNLIGHPSRWIHDMLDGALRYVVGGPYDIHVRHGFYLLLVSGLIPWLILALLGRGRPHDFGLRRPNVLGWRILCVGYVIAIPFLIWMVRSPSFAGPYLGELRRAGPTIFIIYYFANMLTEHFLIHGAVLAACRPGMRWPPPPPVASEAVNGPLGALRWLGLAQPTAGLERFPFPCSEPRASARAISRGSMSYPYRLIRHTKTRIALAGMRRATRWIGLPDGCTAAVLTSTVLFSMVHVGKDPRELLLSLPGGVALAYVSFRTNSWLTPFVLHLATAGTACLMIVVSQ